MSKVLLIELGAGALPETTPPVFAPASWFPVIYTPPAPTIPADFLATPVADAVLLTWNESTAYAPEYLVERADDNNGVPGEWVEVAKTTERRYLSVEPSGYAAWFRVRAAALSQMSPYTPQLIAAPISSNPPRIELQIIAGVVTINCIYNQFYLKLTTSVTVQFVNVRPSQTILVEAEQAGTGANEIDWGPSVVPVSGVPYVASPQVGAVDMVGLATNSGGATWRLTAQQPSPATAPPGGGDPTGGAPTVSLSPSPAVATVTSDGVTPIAPSVTITATIAGGTAPITNAWTRADSGGGANFQVDDPTSATPTFSIPAGTAPFSATQTWRNTVTDSATLTGQSAVAITLSRVINSLLNGWNGLTAAVTGNNNTPYQIGGGLAMLQFRRDGTWVLQTTKVENGKTYPDVMVVTGYWHGNPTPTIGDQYEVQCTVSGTSDGGGSSKGSISVTSGMSTFYSLANNQHITLTYFRTASGSATVTRVVAVTLREIATPANSVAGSSTLQVTGTQS